MLIRNPYLSLKTRIDALQRWIILHSIVYYHLNDSIISDRVFDLHCAHLLEMRNESPETFEKSEYFHVFEDFDGTTGFDLYDRLSEADKKYLCGIAETMLKLYKKGGSENE